jgi:hypothetical protein
MFGIDYERGKNKQPTKLNVLWAVLLLAQGVCC